MSAKKANKQSKPTKIHRRLKYIEYELHLESQTFEFEVIKCDDALIPQDYLMNGDGAAICFKNKHVMYAEDGSVLPPLAWIREGNLLEVYLNGAGRFQHTFGDSVKKANLERALSDLDELLQQFDANARTIKRIK